jgi:hypothetical protein
VSPVKTKVANLDVSPTDFQKRSKEKARTISAEKLLNKLLPKHKKSKVVKIKP